MTKIPDVPTDIWSNLYDAALHFQKLAPWKFMADEELFAVRDEETGETGYACVLGAGGTVFALCLYRGAEGFDAHRRMQAGELTEESDDLLTAQNCLMASFEDREHLDKSDLAVVKALGLKFRGAKAWPMFRSHLPGYLPWMLTADESLFLTEALMCARVVAKKIEDGLDIHARPGYVLTYVLRDGGNFEESWEPQPVYRPQPLPPLKLDADMIARAKAKAVKRDGPWEADAFYVPTPIGDKARPYFPRMVLAVHQPSGCVFPPTLGSPEDSPHQLLARALLATVTGTGTLPIEVRVKNEELAQALMPLGAALGIPIIKKRLAALEEARESMVEAMSRGRL